jgi:hypothetical protein
MGTLDDRNKPVDPFNTRKSIDDCSGEEWSAAARAFWEKMEEDPHYQKQESLFDGDSLFEDTDPLRQDEDEHAMETQFMLNDEKQFEQIVQVLGPYDAISYCHGAALEILLNLDNCLNNAAAIRKASRALDRMARLTEETRGVFW